MYAYKGGALINLQKLVTVRSVGDDAILTNS